MVGVAVGLGVGFGTGALVGLPGIGVGAAGGVGVGRGVGMAVGPALGCVEGARDVSHGSIVAEEESAGTDLTHDLKRIQRECEVEIRRRSRRTDLGGLGYVYAGGITRV